MLKPTYTVISLVKELAQIRNDLVLLNKKEQELKKELKSYMGDERLLVADDYCILIEDRNRMDLDKDALIQELGIELFSKYQKRTTYEVMLIKPLKKVGQS